MAIEKRKNFTEDHRHVARIEIANHVTKPTIYFGRIEWDGFRNGMGILAIHEALDRTATLLEKVNTKVSQHTEVIGTISKAMDQLVVVLKENAAEISELRERVAKLENPSGVMP